MLSSMPLMFSNLTLVSVDFRLKIGGVQYQGKKLGRSEPNPGQGIAGNLPVLSAFQGLRAAGSCRKMMGSPLHSGDIVLSSEDLGSTSGSRADKQASSHWRSTWVAGAPGDKRKYPGSLGQMCRKESQAKGKLCSSQLSCL